MASELTPEAIAELRRLHAEATDRSLSAYKRMQAQAKVSDLMTWNGHDGGDGDLPALLDAAERCAAAEAQAKAAGELLRAAKVARDRLIDTGSPKTAAALAAAIETAERAGVKP